MSNLIGNIIMISRALASRFFNGQKPLKSAIQKGILCTMSSNSIGLAEFITTKEQNARHTALLDAFICGFQSTHQNHCLPHDLSNPGMVPRMWVGTARGSGGGALDQLSPAMRKYQVDAERRMNKLKAANRHARINSRNKKRG